MNEPPIDEIPEFFFSIYKTSIQQKLYSMNNASSSLVEVLLYVIQTVGVSIRS